MEDDRSRPFVREAKKSLNGSTQFHSVNSASRLYATLVEGVRFDFAVIALSGGAWLGAALSCQEYGIPAHVILHPDDIGSATKHVYNASETIGPLVHLKFHKTGVPFPWSALKKSL
ncbi:MAG: hypothetical protein QY318_04710 [Candidatus Dojkabacteria bacterium]|nr:MAG: hypothetical protein QY318_04710 [Candidatus Dojkabacteria bacterium]